MALGFVVADVANHQGAVGVEELVVLHVGRHVGLGAAGAGGPDEGGAGAAAEGHAGDRSVDWVGGTQAIELERVAEVVEPLAVAHRAREVADGPDAEVGVRRFDGVEVVGHLLVGVGLPCSFQDGLRQNLRDHYFELVFEHALVGADEADRGIGAVLGAKGAGAAGPERGLIVVADPAGAGGEHGLGHVVGMILGHVDGELAESA